LLSLEEQGVVEPDFPGYSEGVHPFP